MSFKNQIKEFYNSQNKLQRVMLLIEWVTTILLIICAIINLCLLKHFNVNLGVTMFLFVGVGWVATEIRLHANSFYVKEVVSYFGRLKFSTKQKWYEIKCYFKPKQKWLLKKIPNTWTDKDYLWEVCILEGFKHYVECEIGHKELFDKDRWKGRDGVPEHQLLHEEEVRKYYNLLTVTLPKLEKEYETEWNSIPTTVWDIDANGVLQIPERPTYEEKYGEADRLEKQVHDLKTKIMLWCIVHRDSIWT